MNASPPIATLFAAWAHSELAAHYAQPCPDALMDHLTNRISLTKEALASAPARVPGDIALKMFPVILYEYEPKIGEAPLVPNPESAHSIDEGLIASILADIRQFFPEVAALIDTPHYSATRAERAAA
jgi:hypothetical protein